MDMWALGVTLYCFVHGYCPFDDVDEMSVYQKIMVDNPVYKPTLSESLVSLLEGFLNKNPNKRITIEKIKTHDWTTDYGRRPMMPTKYNCTEEISDDMSTDLKAVFFQMIHKFGKGRRGESERKLTFHKTEPS